MNIDIEKTCVPAGERLNRKTAIRIARGVRAVNG